MTAMWFGNPASVRSKARSGVGEPPAVLYAKAVALRSERPLKQQ
jgi:hypothetical protein